LPEQIEHPNLSEMLETPTIKASHVREESAVGSSSGADMCLTNLEINIMPDSAP